MHRARLGLDSAAARGSQDRRTNSMNRPAYPGPIALVLASRGT